MVKDNSGALFKEADKKSDKHPDYKGNCLVNGKKMYISAWVNTAESGKKYMSLSFSEPTQSANYNAKTTTSTEAPAFAKNEDDLPF